MKLLSRLPHIKPETLLIGAGILIALIICYGQLYDIPAVSLFPILAVSVLVLIYDYRVAYYLLMLSLPFSFNYALPGGVTVDFPSELLMLVLTGCFLISAPLNKPIDAEFLSHPICRILVLMLMWAMVCTLFSVEITKSVKYILAKIWYLVSFVLVTGALIKNLNDLKRILWFFMAGLIVTVTVSIAKHASFGFAFDMVNRSVIPFFYNHVIYAATVAMFIPFTFWLWLRAKGHTLQRVFLFGVLLLLLLAVALSYTRASWLSIPVAVLYLLVLRFHLTKLVLIAASAGVICASVYMAHNNNYLQYAPDFEKTVYYGGNIEKHLEATYSFEDVSGMERVYRWVAAARMSYANPVFGTGPNTFYPEYKRY
ncbi:MAG: O-antigen ligase domain-containing protein, partial [Sphingobacteriales bacterium]